MKPSKPPNTFLASITAWLYSNNDEKNNSNKEFAKPTRNESSTMHIENGSNLQIWKPKKRNTILAVFIVSLGSFSIGTTLSYSAPVLVDPEFKKQFPNIGNGSWVASITLLGGLLSATMSGFLMSKLGRKGTMLLIALPFAVGWAMIAFASNIASLYCGRFLTGFCAGILTVVSPTYVSEIAEDSFRGTLGISLSLMANIGKMFLFILGAMVDWFELSIICGCVPIMFLFGMLLIPESPRYLIETEKPVVAQKALAWLRGAPDERCIEPEFRKLEESVIISRQPGRKIKKMDLFTLRVMKPVGLCCALMFFMKMGGMNGVSLYTLEIFQEAETGMNAHLVCIVLAAIQTVTILVIPFLFVDKMGRRTLMTLSLSVMFLSLMALGWFFYLKVGNDGETPDYVKWLPLVSLIFITIGYNFGLGSIPWVVTSEILPEDAKELGSSFVSICYWFMTFISGKTFQDIRDFIGYMGLYWLSAGICLAGVLFVFFVLPETKGKSFQEIQLLVQNKISHTESSGKSEKVTSSCCTDNPAYVS